MRIDNGGDDPFATPMGSVNGEPSMDESNVVDDDIFSDAEQGQ